MKISYLVTVKNETDTLKKLLHRLDQSIWSPPIYDERAICDEIIILDDFSINKETHDLIDYFVKPVNRQIIQHHLNNDYGSHKNFGIEKCKGNFIFQIDGDELPSESLLGENLHAIIGTNSDIEAFAVPRINDFKGVTEEHAKQWGWRLTESPTYKRPIVNWPDYQFRIFRKDYPRISFTRRLHEKIEGYSTFATLPPSEEYALYHDKTIEKQVETNIKYNQLFTQEENRGHSVFEQK